VGGFPPTNCKTELRQITDKQKKKWHLVFFFWLEEEVKCVGGLKVGGCAGVGYRRRRRKGARSKDLRAGGRPKANEAKAR
jgi:hypothetical protein